MSKRVTVIFSDEEFRQVKEAAGLVPMSAWIRALTLYKSLPVAQAADVVVKEIEAATQRIRPTMDLTTCPHNMMKAACPRCKNA